MFSRRQRWNIVSERRFFSHRYFSPAFYTAFSSTIRRHLNSRIEIDKHYSASNIAALTVRRNHTINVDSFISSVRFYFFHFFDCILIIVNLEFFKRYLKYDFYCIVSIN